VKAKVFIVDDHPLVREWLSALINNTADLTVCGEAGDLNTAMEGITNAGADVAIIDLSLRYESGFDLIRILKRRFPLVTSIVLSMHDQDVYVARAMRAGAKGYIVKCEPTANIVHAIRLVLKGDIYISPELSERSVQTFASSNSYIERTPVTKLSNRELEVFQFIGWGYGTREIAEQLKLDMVTVQTYCTRIKKKLELQSGAELLRVAMKWNGKTLV